MRPSATAEQSTCVSEKGVTAFEPDAAGKRRLIRLTGTNEEAVHWLNEMLERALCTMTHA